MKVNVFGVMDQKWQARRLPQGQPSRGKAAPAKLRLWTLLFFSPCVIVGLQELLVELARLTD
jgi:hypothetical protein